MFELGHSMVGRRKKKSNALTRRLEKCSSNISLLKRVKHKAIHRFYPYLPRNAPTFIEVAPQAAYLTLTSDSIFY